MNQNVEISSPELVMLAFKALEEYHEGSGRGALLPLDRAVAAADPLTRGKLEGRFLEALQRCRTDVAQEYIYSKLALCGSDKSIAPLIAAALLDAPFAAAARTALEKIPGSKARKALSQSIAQARGREKAMLIDSLAARQEPESAEVFAKALKDDHPGVFAAAAAGLGRLGTPRAATVLTACRQRVPVPADALMACAEGLQGKGYRKQAGELYSLLVSPTYPPWVRDAAEGALKECS